MALSTIRHGAPPALPAPLLPAPALAVAAEPGSAGANASDVASDRAGDIVGVTDPSVIKQGDAYYVFSSGPGVPIRRSTDLTHWKAVGQAFEGIPDWALARVPDARSIWAPDISFFNGEYHLYYSVSSYGSNRSVIGLATNRTLDPASPAYHWVDQGEVIASRPGRSNWNAIDPQLAFDGDSQPWLAFGSQWSGIKLVRIDPATGKPMRGGAHPALASLARRQGSQPIEAPYIVRHDGAYYLFVSFDRCCLGTASTYKIMVGRAAQIGGPYLDRSGQPMSRGGGTLVLDGQGRYRGPGHNAVLAAGGQSWLFYHTYDAEDGGLPRLQARPLVWGPDGWPIVGDPVF